MRRGIPLLALLAACGSNEHLAQPTPEIARRPASAFVEGAGAVDALRARLAEQGSVILRSWSGQWIGTDRDADLQLLPKGKARVVEYGDGVRVDDGRYELTPDGRLRVRAKGIAERWPELILGADGPDLQARPAATPELGYWPFRSIPLQARNRYHD